MRNKIKQIVTLCLAMTFTSCGIYTKFTPSGVDDTTLAGDNFTLREESITPLPSWREYFTDANLVALIEEALESNADLRIAGLNITQAERNLQTARLAMAPSLSIGADGSVTRTGSFTTNSYNIPVTASWEVDIFGRLRNSKMQTQAVVEQMKLYESSVHSQLIAAVATNYYALILADNQSNVTRQSQTIMEQSLKTIKALKETGSQTEAAVAQSEANLRAIELTATSLEQSVQLISNNLNLLLNRSPQTIVRSEAIVCSQLNTRESLSLSALSSRPDVLYAEAVLCQSFYGVNYARSSLYPSIGISASVGYSAGDWLLSAIGSITQPIFMANANRAALKNAKDVYEQSLISFELALLTAGKEVNDAVVDLKAAEQKRVTSIDRTAHLNRAVEITSELMNMGRVNYLEVLVAQDSYLASSLELEGVKYDEAIAQISLYISLGGGVE